MGDDDLVRLLQEQGVSGPRLRLARWVESGRVQRFVVAVILANAVVLGLETHAGVMAQWGGVLKLLDRLCLLVFVVELGVKLFSYRGRFWRSGWNVFDFLVVAIAVVPGAGVLAVLRSLRVLRVLRLLTVVPGLRRVVAAFIHAIPGLSGVMTVLAIFLYTAAVLATKLFGADYPEWFGGLGRSLFSLFQVLTLEGWADMARRIMETHPWAVAFFIPFILIATFTVLNLFIGIIVSTMQELAVGPEPGRGEPGARELLGRIEGDLRALRAQLERPGRG